MRKVVGITLLLIFLLTVNPQLASAKIVINEFSSATVNDWVELYNDGEESVNLSQFRIRDSTQTNKLDLTGTLAPQSFTSFDWYNKLNKLGDVVKLVKISDESIDDQVAYGDQADSIIAAPGESQSAGREQDGGATWIVFSSSTKGLSNNAGTVAPSPTLIPTDVPAPTKTPTPTKIPEPTKTPTPTKVPTPTKTPMPTKNPTPLSVSVSPTAKQAVLGEKKSTRPSIEQVTKKEQKNYPTAILGERVEISPTKKPISNQKNTQHSSFVPIAFIGGGALFLVACGILAFRAYKKRKYERTDSNNE